MTLSRNRQRSYSAEELEEHTGFDRRTIAYYVQEGLLPRVGRRGPRTRYPALVRDRLLFIQRVREAEEMGEIEPLSLNDLRQLFAKLSPSIIFEVADQMAPVRLAVAALAKTVDEATAQRKASARHIAREQTWRAMESAPEYESAYESAKTQDTQELLRATAAASTTEAPRRMPKPKDEDLDYEPEAAASLHEEDKLLYAAEALQAPKATEKAAGENTVAELTRLLSQLDYRAGQGSQHSPDDIESWSRVRITEDIELAVRGLRAEDESLLADLAKQIRRLIVD